MIGKEIEAKIDSPLTLLAVKSHDPVSVAPGGSVPFIVQGEPSSPSSPFSPLQTWIGEPLPSISYSTPPCSSQASSSGSITFLTITDLPAAPAAPAEPVLPVS